MFFSPAVMFESQTTPTKLPGYERADHLGEDPPPAEQPSESYSSWRPTSIFSLSPFVAPPLR